MKNFYRHIFILASCLFLSSTYQSLATTNTPTSSIKELQRYQKEMFLLQKDIAIQKGMEKEENLKEQSILQELEFLDLKLQTHQSKLHTYLENSQKQKEKIARQEAELVTLKLRRDQEVEHLQTRGVAFYTMGKIGLLNAIFSSRTLPDLLALHNSFESILQYDKKIIRAYEQTLELQKRTQRALKLENIVLESLIELIKEEKKQVVDTQRALLAKLEEVRGQKKLRQQAINELRNASTQLTSAIAQVKDEVVRKQGQFLNDKGKLPMPVKNGLIKTKYQQQTTNAFGQNYRCDGIEIEVPDQTEVLAISDGKVFFAGYLQGYGNTVIIRHGVNYYTILSRLGKIVVKENREVNQGEKIALSGETATLFANGLYFEIRHKEQQQDPLLWIDSKQVRFKKDSKSKS